MSYYKRVVYMDCYKNGEKVSNGGFVKLLKLRKEDGAFARKPEEAERERLCIQIQALNLPWRDELWGSVKLVKDAREILLENIQLSDGKGMLQIKDLEELLRKNGVKDAGEICEEPGEWTLKVVLTPDSELWCRVGIPQGCKEIAGGAKRMPDAMGEEGRAEETVTQCEKCREMGEGEPKSGNRDGADEPACCGMKSRSEERKVEKKSGKRDERKVADECEAENGMGERNIENGAGEREMENGPSECKKERGSGEHETERGSSECETENDLGERQKERGSGEHETERGLSERKMENNPCERKIENNPCEQEMKNKPDTKEKRKETDERRSQNKSVRITEKMQRDKWKQLWEIFLHICPFQDEREYLRLDLRDLLILTGRYYRLVENSFLLHGYYNYEHLVLMRTYRRGAEKYYLGVPGNYYEREKQVAVWFGFESFETGSEPAAEGDFGYYMISVDI